MNPNFDFLIIKDRHEDRLRQAEQARLIRQLEAQNPKLSLRQAFARLIRQLNRTELERPHLPEEFKHRPAPQKS